MDRTAAFYSQPSYVQRGLGLPVYSGSRRQRGGSVLGALKGFVMPVINQVKKSAKGEAWRLAKGLAADAIRGRNLTESVKTRGMESLKRLGKDVFINTTAGAIRKTTGNRTAPIHPGSASRKRKAPVKKRVPAKKRRVRNF